MAMLLGSKQWLWNDVGKLFSVSVATPTVLSSKHSFVITKTLQFLTISVSFPCFMVAKSVWLFPYWILNVSTQSSLVVGRPWVTTPVTRVGVWKST